MTSLRKVEELVGGFHFIAGKVANYTRLEILSPTDIYYIYVCVFVYIHVYIYIYSEQIIATSAKATPNGGVVREFPPNPLNSGLGTIVICPDILNT